jgi:hypothetical protein
LQKILRHVENRLDLLVGEIVNRDDVTGDGLRFRHQSGLIGPIAALGQAPEA